MKEIDYWLKISRKKELDWRFFFLGLVLGIILGVIL